MGLRLERVMVIDWIVILIEVSEAMIVHKNGNFIRELLTKFLVLVYVKYNKIQYNKMKENKLRGSCFLFEPDHIHLIHACQIQRN
jgi:hypothetical protein